VGYTSNVETRKFENSSRKAGPSEGGDAAEAGQEEAERRERKGKRRV